MLRILCLLLSFVVTISYANNQLATAITQPIPISQLADFSTAPPVVKDLILLATQLSKMNLTYLYGSADPKNKGMDCSGTIYYLLSQKTHSDIPRSSDELFNWVEKSGKLYKVTANDFNSSEFSNLKPGDLLFWSGTYVTHRASSITHVMLYLGKNKAGERLMFGSSDGRTYQGKKMWGVSVFDFNLPDGKGSPRFVGYGCIPSLTCVRH